MILMTSAGINFGDEKYSNRRYTLSLLLYNHVHAIIVMH